MEYSSRCSYASSDEGEIEEYKKLVNSLKLKLANSQNILETIKLNILVGSDFEKIITIVREIKEVEEKWNEYTMVLRLTGYDGTHIPKEFKIENRHIGENEIIEKTIKQYADEVALLNKQNWDLRNKITELAGEIIDGFVRTTAYNDFDENIPWKKSESKSKQYDRYIVMTQHFKILVSPIFEHELVQEKWDELMVILRKHGYTGIDGYLLK